MANLEMIGCYLFNVGYVNRLGMDSLRKHEDYMAYYASYSYRWDCYITGILFKEKNQLYE